MIVLIILVIIIIVLVLMSPKAYKNKITSMANSIVKSNKGADLTQYQDELSNYDKTVDPNYDPVTGKRIMYDKNGYPINRPLVWLWVVICIAYWVSPIDIIPDALIAFYGVGVFDDVIITVYTIMQFYKLHEFDRKLDNLIGMDLDEITSTSFKIITTEDTSDDNKLKHTKKEELPNNTDIKKF